VNRTGREKVLLGLGLASMSLVPVAIIQHSKFKNRRMNRPLEEDLERLKAKGRSLTEVPRA
jgi:hypothetical protein